jgi:hypothetical protein
MAFKKPGSTAERPAAVAEQPSAKAGDQAQGLSRGGEQAQPESGATAAIERLSKPKAEAMQKPKYVPRDLESEAIGKTRCVMFAAALQSPALAGLRFNDVGEFLSIVREAADAGVVYSFRK